MKNLQFQIDGMSCGGCVRGVRSALEGMDGVEPREVGIGSASISCDESKTSPDEILQRLEKAGFPARVVAEKQAEEQG